MILLADENVDAPIVAELRAAGHRVDYVRELDPGIDDQTVLAFANGRDALLLTSDKDFGELVFRRRLVPCLSGWPLSNSSLISKSPNLT
jgi:predicted nuclease of predicted toxin-antitoxin system